MPNVSMIDGHIDELKKHKCDGCKYKGEHQEMGFKAVGVCFREHNLLKAEIAYNAKKCPFSNPTNYDRIRNMSVEEMAKEFAMFVWKTVCECDKVQQRMCEHYGMPDGGCIQCITNDIEEWLESEVKE